MILLERHMDPYFTKLFTFFFVFRSIYLNFILSHAYFVFKGYQKQKKRKIPFPGGRRYGTFFTNLMKTRMMMMVNLWQKLRKMKTKGTTKKRMKEGHQLMTKRMRF